MIIGRYIRKKNVTRIIPSRGNVLSMSLLSIFICTQDSPSTDVSICSTSRVMSKWGWGSVWQISDLHQFHSFCVNYSKSRWIEKLISIQVKVIISNVTYVAKYWKLDLKFCTFKFVAKQIRGVKLWEWWNKVLE